MFGYLRNKRTYLLIFILGGFGGFLLARGGASIEQVFQNPEKANKKIEVADFELIKDDSIVILTFGQSNSANFGYSRRGYYEGVYNFHHGRLYEAADPLIGADGDKGSVWTRLGEKIRKTQKEKNVIFITIGVGNSSIYRWSRYGDLHNKLLDALNSAKDSGLDISYILWHQGESDANLFKTSKTDYKNLFEDIVKSIRNNNDVPIFVSLATRIKNATLNEIIRSAQVGLVDDIDVFLGPDTDQIGEFYRYDGTHFNDEGLDKVSDLWMQSIFGTHIIRN